MAADLPSDQQLHNEKKKSENFNTSPTRLITFSTHEADSGFSPEIDERLCCQQGS